MKVSDCDVRVDVLDIYKDSYNQALCDGDIASIKRILLKSCRPEQANKIEELLPADLIKSLYNA